MTRTSMYAMDSRSSLLLCSMPKWLLMLSEREREEWGGREGHRKEEEERKKGKCRGNERRYAVSEQ